MRKFCFALLSLGTRLNLSVRPTQTGPASALHRRAAVLSEYGKLPSEFRGQSRADGMVK